ncbi:MAG: hypothetical protein K6B65_00665 [Bacilli bacterium]|nr:hypothetical protein [Bacilli bacterium]
MKIVSLLPLLPLLFSSLSLSSCTSGNDIRSQKEIEGLGYQKIDFSWQCGDKETGNDYFYYKDAFFGEDASKLNLSFAHVGYAWALSNFAAGTSKGDYTHQDVNAAALSKSIGFDSFESNEFFKQKPSVESLGISCAKKSLSLEEGKATAILVGIRGAGYEAEWGSNFTLGQAGDHPGFNAAADRVVSYVNGFIDKHNISGNIKILVSGYSRAAATTNLFAGKIDNSLTNGTPLLRNSVKFDKDDVFAYCFEPPAGAIREDYSLDSNAYSNIHCFINPNDLVPLVAPNEYGFARFGNQYFYPNSLSTLDYQGKEDKMLRFLNEMLSVGHSKYGGYAISSFVPHAPDSHGSFFAKDTSKINWTVENEVRHLISSLANSGLKSRQNFFLTIQSGLINTIKLVYEKGPEGEATPFSLFAKALVKELLNIEMSKSLIDDLTIEELHPYFTTDFTPFLIRAFHSFMPELDLSIIQEIASGLSGLFVGVAEVAFEEPSLISSMIDMHNLAAMSHAHYPEINYFWLKAYDPLIYKEPIPANFKQSWSRICLNEVNDVEVFDSKSNLVMKIEKDVPVDLHNDYVYGVRQISRSPFYEFYLPGDQTYTVRAASTTRDITSWIFSIFDTDKACERFFLPKSMEEKESDVYEIIIPNIY